jgi:hypothetical protein
MQEALSQPSPRLGIPFSEFFRSLIEALGRTGLRFCILRNYEGFPARNTGRDIDFLIDPSDLPHAIHALRSLAGVRIVGYLQRPSVAMLYLEGICTVAGGRCLEVDFDLSLDWKGLPFLPLNAVLDEAVPRHAGGVGFRVPKPAHEAVNSLMASLLVGGWIQEKYFPRVQQTFACDGVNVLAALAPQFGFNTAKRLVNAVVEGDRRNVLGSIPSLRITLALRSFLRRPMRSSFSMVQHYWAECMLRFSTQSLEEVGIAGADREARSNIIASLLPMLRHSAAVVEKHNGMEGSNLRRKSSPPDSDMYFAGTDQMGAIASTTSVAILLVRTWRAHFRERRNLTLRICGGDYQDMLMNPHAYRFGGPLWIARLIGQLMPSSGFRISLDMPAQAMDAVNVYAAIIDGLAERAGEVLRTRFQQRKPSN